MISGWWGGGRVVIMFVFKTDYQINQVSHSLGCALIVHKPSLGCSSNSLQEVVPLEFNLHCSSLHLPMLGPLSGPK